MADVANNYINKGTKVYIEGELRTRSYRDAQGITRYITEVYGYSMELLTPKGDENKPPTPEPEMAPSNGHNNPNDDLPF